MRKWLVVPVLTLLAACEEPRIDPAMNALRADCSAGNMASCGQVAQIDAQNRTAYYQTLQSNLQAQSANNAALINGMMRQPTPYRPQPLQTTTTCRPIYGGGFQCF